MGVVDGVVVFAVDESLKIHGNDAAADRVCGGYRPFVGSASCFFRFFVGAVRADEHNTREYDNDDDGDENFHESDAAFLGGFFHGITSELLFVVFSVRDHAFDGKLHDIFFLIWIDLF